MVKQVPKHANAQAEAFGDNGSAAFFSLTVDGAIWGARPPSSYLVAKLVLRLRKISFRNSLDQCCPRVTMSL